MAVSHSPQTVTLVSGGVRSGKSSYALACAEALTGRKIFLATAPVSVHHGMEQRIALHQAERDPTVWTTVEESREIIDTIGEMTSVDVLVVDCLTLWLSNLLLDDATLNEESVRDLANRLVQATRKSGANTFFVTNEVGMGIHPMTELGRRFEDLQGRMNQVIGRAVDKVVLMVCGRPMFVTG